MNGRYTHTTPPTSERPATSWTADELMNMSFSEPSGRCPV
jgi:hypothetical protein